ncbi:hypothetical protein AB0F73_00695 [Micromonospora purpureochromogenes]|uniref:hypothetical protein n=1 Tax=Micromonospora purpureochromogenes TaxID=47872 RepID=UPI0033CBA6AD
MPLTDEETRDRSDLREAVEQLAPEPTVVLIGYACNSEAGLLRVSWGEATLTRSDELDWGPVEELPLPGDPSRDRRGFAA